MLYVVQDGRGVTKTLPADVIHKFPYVCPFSWRIQTPFGRVYIPKGWLSDGATGVPDVCPPAFFTHDRLYAWPFINGRRIGKAKCDLIYGILLFKHWRPFRAFERPVGLTLFGWSAWNKCREREKADEHWWHEQIVDHAAEWDFPSFYSRDAVIKQAALNTNSTKPRGTQ